MYCTIIYNYTSSSSSSLLFLSSPSSLQPPSGQAAMFCVGLTSSLLIALNRVGAGTMSVGDLVAVNSMLLQLSIPFNFMGFTCERLTALVTAITVTHHCHSSLSLISVTHHCHSSSLSLITVTNRLILTGRHNISHRRNMSTLRCF